MEFGGEDERELLVRLPLGMHGTAHLLGSESGLVELHGVVGLPGFHEQLRLHGREDHGLGASVIGAASVLKFKSHCCRLRREGKREEAEREWKTLGEMRKCRRSGRDWINGDVVMAARQGVFIAATKRNSWFPGEKWGFRTLS